MKIPEVSNFIVQTALAVSGSSAKKAPTQDDILTVMMASFLTEVHQIIMDSWEKFADTQKAIAREKDIEDRLKSRKFAAIEGQRRQVEQ